MKTFTITEEQIAQLVKSAKNESGQLIIADLKNWFPETDKIETRRWYVVKHTSMQDAFIFLQEEKVKYTYGFNHYGEWTDTYNNENLYSNYRGDILRLATKDEVESLLIAEAKRRGVWNKPMVNVSGFKQTTNENYYVGYDHQEDKLWSSYGRVYQSGEWATPIVEGTIEDRLSRIEKHLGL